MAVNQFTNNATGTLAAGIGPTSTQVTLTSGEGALFPSPTGGKKCVCTFNKNGNTAVNEIVWVTARTNDTLTIVRHQENTAALPWNAGDFFSLLWTSGDAQQFAQIDDLQAQTGNYAIDVGSANAYSVNLTPALTQGHVVGMPIRWKANNGNTAACTFNDGQGAGQLVMSPGLRVPYGTIVPGGVYTSIWDGTEFQLVTAASYLTTTVFHAGIAIVWNSNPGTYFKIATLPPTSNATADVVHINASLNFDYQSSNWTVLDGIFGNRGGFNYFYNIYGGNNTTTAIRCYTEGDGSVSVYAYCSFTYGAANITLNNIGVNGITAVATIYPNPTSTTSPTGTLVFDSVNTATYKPLLNISSPTTYATTAALTAALLNYATLADLTTSAAATLGAADAYTDSVVASLSASGTFTGTLTGMSSVLSGPVEYFVQGPLVTLTINIGQGSSNSNSLTLTGLPTFLQVPVTFTTPSQQATLMLYDANLPVLGVAFIGAGVPTITFAKAFASGSSIEFSSVFTASLSKGVNSGASITYRRA